MTDEIAPKIQNNFSCEACHFICCKKSEWSRHVTTRKHLKLTNTDIKTPKLADKIMFYYCECGNIYKHRQSLFNHKKKCHYKNDKDDIDNLKDTTKITPEVILMLIKENSELKNIMVEQQNKMIEQQNIFLEIAKNGTNNTTNTTNTTNSHNNNNNKTFNLQFFLNETCKDAMNIMDFVDQIVLNLKDLEETGRIGFAEGISKIINKHLKALDVTQRPIHCSDLKRETLYIKNENKWEKEEDDKPMLKTAVKQIAGKNMMQIFDWQKAHPDFKDSDSRTSDRYMKMLTNVMSGGTVEETQENYEKIIKNVVKEAGIVKENFLI
jgi:hypothetical protein